MMSGICFRRRERPAGPEDIINAGGDRKESEVRKSALIIAGLAVILAAGCSKTDRKDLIVAEVETNTITIGDFETTAETLENKYLPETSDMAGKKDLLQHMVNKEIMALKAEALGYEKEEAFNRFWTQFRGPFLITALWDQKISKSITVTEADIDKYWEEMHYEYTLSQIVVANEQDALLLRERILAGEDFAQLAKDYSLGPGAENGGFVGSSPVGKISWWVEEMLFTMKEEEISQPVRTDSGWTLIKIMKKRKIVPDEDREYASRRVKGIKEYKGRDVLKEQIERDINLQIFTDAVNIVYNALPEDVPFEDIVNYKVTRDNAPALNIEEQYLNMMICQYDDGMYTIKDFIDLYNTVSLVERPRRQYGRENIVQLLKKIIYDKVLPVYAEEVARVLEIPEVKKNYDNRREQYLVYRLYQDQIEDEITITIMEMQEFYDSNKDFIRTKERRDYQVIVLDKEEAAKIVEKRAKEGENFDKLVREFSKDPSVKENMGKTGLVYPGNFLEYDGVAFALAAVGDVSDAFQITRGWAVVKLLQIEPGRLPSFEEASQTIKQDLTGKKGEALLQEKLKKWSEEYKIKINERNLAKAEMKRTRL